MRKNICLILLTAIIMSVMISCTNNMQNNTEGNSTADSPPVEIKEKDEYVIMYATDSAQCLTGLRFKREFNIKRTTYVEDGIPNVQYKIGEKDNVLKYSFTQDDGLFNGISRVFQCNNIDGSATNSYSQSGELLSECISKHVAEKQLDESELFNIASEKMKKLVNDPESYTFARKIHNDNWAGDWYFFEWTRANGKLKTMEVVQVHIFPDGVVRETLKAHIGDMKDVPTVPDAVVEKVLNTVQTNLEKKYGEVKENFSIIDINKDEADLCLIRLKDGTVALDLSIDVLVGKNGTDETATETHRYIVPLE